MIDYGRKLSQKEYELFIVTLFETSKNLKEINLKKTELNLHIDYRLGLDFPTNRREKIWQIYSKIEKKELFLILNILPNRVKHYLWSKFLYYIGKDFLSVLSKDELEALFGIEEKFLL